MPTSAASTRTAGVYTRANRSTKVWLGARCDCARSTRSMIRASVESARIRSTRTSRPPRPLMVPANTSSPAAFSTGSDSPVTGAWFTWLTPPTTRPSRGTFSPGRTITTSPTLMSSTGTRRDPSGCEGSLTSASAGVRSISPRVETRPRSIARPTSRRASADKPHVVPLRPLPQPHRAGVRNQHEQVDVERGRAGGVQRALHDVEAATRDGERERRHRRAPIDAGQLERHARARQHSRQDDEHASGRRRGRRPDGLFVLEPGAHPRLRDRFRNGHRGQLRRVVIDVHALPENVGVQRLEPRELLQTFFEDRHFLVAVHALDLERRLGVELADLAGHPCFLICPYVSG